MTATGIDRLEALGARRRWLFPGVVVAVALLVYANTLLLRFAFDDNLLLLDDPRMADPWGYIRHMLFERKLWRPLERIALMADVAIWGIRRPWGFHLTNNLLHAGACLSLYLLLVRIGTGRLVALVTGALFAVHPIHVEAVAHISHRKEPMALLFSLLAFHAYLNARGPLPRAGPAGRLLGRLGLLRGKGRTRLLRAEQLGYAFLCYLLGMASKEVGAVMLPVVVAAWERLLGGGAPRELAARLRPALVPFGAVLVLFTLRGYLGSLPRRFSPEQIAWITQDETTSYARLLLGVLKAFAMYLHTLVWPRPLYLDRSFPLPASLADPWVLAGLGALGLYLGALVVSRRRWRFACFALAWYGLNWLPVSNLVPLTYWLFAERFAYVPSVGYSLLLGLGFAALWRGAGRLARPRAARGLLASLLVAYGWIQGYLTLRQNLAWKDNGILWAHTLLHNPRSLRAVYGFGQVFKERGDFVRAERQYRRAVELEPRYAEPRYELAFVLKQLGRHGECLEQVDLFLSIKTEDPLGLLVRGNCQFGLGDFEGAARTYRRILGRDPRNLLAWTNLGSALYQAGRLPEALGALEEALRLQPDADLLRMRDQVREELEAAAPSPR